MNNKKRKKKMKKLLVLLVAAGLASFGHAAALDWSYTATSAENGQTVYVLLGATAVDKWESIDALSGQSVNSGVIGRKGMKYMTSGSFTSDAVTKESADVYFVIVSADKSTFSVTSVADMSASVYDPANQESSSGANASLSPDSITKKDIAWGTGGGDEPGPGDDPTPGPDNPPTPGPGGDGDVPEPTSGILLMIGGAALALRRRR